MSRANPSSDDPEDLQTLIAKVLSRAPEPEPARLPPTKRQLLEGFGFPKRALDVAERADESLEAIATIRSYVEPGVLVLAGEKGSGKTVAATWWALQRERPSRFITASAFARQSRYGEERKDLLDNFRTLVFDDLGTEYADNKGAFVSDLDELINVAYSERRRLIITTNSDAMVFASRYGDRIVDRLAEAGTWETLTSRTMRPALKALP